jgi:hypothetical protein
MVSQVRSQLRIEGRPKFDTCTKSLYGRVPSEAFKNIIFVHWPALSLSMASLLGAHVINHSTRIILKFPSIRLLELIHGLNISMEPCATCATDRSSRGAPGNLVTPTVGRP